MELTLPAVQAASRTAGARVEVVRDAAAWAALEGEWRELHAASPSAAPPLSWDWAREWWRAYGPVCGAGAGALRIFAVREGGGLIGLLPLYLGWKGRWPAVVRRLRFLGTGER